MAPHPFGPQPGHDSPAEGHARNCLQLLGSAVAVADGSDPVEDWASSGAMALTGEPGGPPQVVTGPAVVLRGALLALDALAPGVALPGLGLLGERAGYTGFTRRGRVTCGGAGRLLTATDGTVALSLARPDDVALVAPLVQAEGIAPADAWPVVAAWVGRRTVAEVRSRTTLLGLPCGVLGETVADAPWTSLRLGSRQSTRHPQVVDLSALWAGPLCASLLRMVGADVLKIEDPRRPDGARAGAPGFFATLNEGHSLLALDLGAAGGRDRLRELVSEADIVIESSRPRALAQMGIVAEEIVGSAGVTWVSITAHGRDNPDRVGYGDDCAVAGGLVGTGPVFAGDAVADPLAGVHAALAAWHSVTHGGGRLIDVALARVASVAAALGGPGADAFYDDGWWVRGNRGAVRVALPSPRAAAAQPATGGEL